MTPRTTEPRDRKAPEHRISEQGSVLVIVLSALNHPIDYLYAGGTPAPPAGPPHVHPIWINQSAVGQLNTAAFLANSAGPGSDPTLKVTPDLSTAYDMSDPTGPDYPYQLRTDMPDVASFSEHLWNRYGSQPAGVNILNSGSHSGAYGELNDPQVTFVTGQLRIDAGQTFEGVGILVLRDDYDPNTDLDNSPTTRSYLRIDGTLRWTGLVVMTGAAPVIRSYPGSDTTIVGAFFGEDSVTSNVELSLETAMIQFQLDGPFRLFYSQDLFVAGGLLDVYMPTTHKRIVGIRTLR